MENEQCQCKKCQAKCECKMCSGFDTEPATIQFWDVTTDRWFNLCKMICEPSFRQLMTHELADHSVPRFRRIQ